MTQPGAESSLRSAGLPTFDGAGGRSSNRHRLLVTMFAIPLAIGFVSGWMGAGRTAIWPMPASLAFWMTMTTAAWLLSFAATWLLARSSAIRRLPLWALLTLGNLLGTPLLYPFAFGLIAAFYQWWIPPELHRPFPETNWPSVLDQRVPGLVLWVGLQLFVAKGLGWDVFGLRSERQQPHDTPGAVRAVLPAVSDGLPPSRGEPGFFARVPEKLGRELIAVSAEQHYLRVVTRAGSCLVLYRMSDAVRELEAHDWPGLQVHRSWWVARRAVTGLERRDGHTLLVLEGGLRAPVSRSFRERAKRAGLLGPVTVTPRGAVEPHLKIADRS